eukprot:6176527-Pleurochrysis_carterae.AAC.4
MPFAGCEQALLDAGSTQLSQDAIGEYYTSGGRHGSRGRGTRGTGALGGERDWKVHQGRGMELMKADEGKRIRQGTRVLVLRSSSKALFLVRRHCAWPFTGKCPPPLPRGRCHRADDRRRTRLPRAAGVVHAMRVT